jgi:hypothetical protein
MMKHSNHLNMAHLVGVRKLFMKLIVSSGRRNSSAYIGQKGHARFSFKM